MAKLSADIMAVLRCPLTGSVLEQQDDWLVSTAPDAHGSRRRYALEEGIPVLLAPQAGAYASDASS